MAILNIERETTNFIEANRMDDIIDQFAKKNESLIHDWLPARFFFLSSVFLN